MGIVFQQAADTVAIELAATHVTSALNRPSGNSGPMVAAVVNTDDAPAFVAFGASTVEADATSAPIAAGERAFFMVPDGATHVSAESSDAGGGDIYITLGYAGYGNVS